MRALIASRHSDHGILGEEKGNVVGTSEISWVIDPIDGKQMGRYAEDS
jgi:fructose-1,6-bisphosphatase/inositol monophosphatase family enzyme